MNPVQLFEKEFRQFIGAEHAVAVVNGTAALHASLCALEVKPGDKVVTTPFTFVATANAILMCGATPIFADIDPATLQIDPAEVEARLEETPEITGVVAVHLFGEMADIDALLKTTKQYGAFLIEDSSQALGAKHNGKHAGTFGDAGTFSFYATKNLWTYEGGMAVTNSHEVAAKLDQIRNHGLHEGEMVRMGFNYKLSWLSAFLGETMLRLHKTAILSELGKLGPKNGYYPQVVYEHPYYKEHGIKGNCPNAERVAKLIKEGEWA